MALFLVHVYTSSEFHGLLAVFLIAVWNTFRSPTMQDKLDSTSLVDSEKNVVPASDTSSLQLDRHGLPLVPQPTRFKDDPLVRVLYL
jgi:hypothetical protein